MNLEALALRLRDEKIAATRIGPPRKREPAPLKLLHGFADRKPTCLCGKCQKCRKRIWMAKFRAGKLVVRYCAACERRLRPENPAPWCSTCKRDRPRAFARYVASLLTDGAGI